MDEIAKTTQSKTLTEQAINLNQIAEVIEIQVLGSKFIPHTPVKEIMNSEAEKDEKEFTEDATISSRAA